MILKHLRLIVGRLGLAALIACGATVSESAVVTFNMIDVAVFASAAPTEITVTTGQVIPGGFDNSAAGSEFTLSTLPFDIDGDIDFNAPDLTNFFDFQLRTAEFLGGQIVFDGFTHFQEPPDPPLTTSVIHEAENSFFAVPFQAGEVIGDGFDEVDREATFTVAVDEGGATTFFQEGDDNFIGFSLDTGNYGWIRIDYDPAGGGGVGTLTFRDGAYEDTGLPIIAGGGAFVSVEGDYNGDGLVNAADYTVWRDNLGLMGTATVAQGDGDGDGDVTNADYTFWADRYGGPGSATATPEPTTFLLSLSALALVGRRG